MNRPRLPAPDALYLGSLLPPLVAAVALVWARPRFLLVVLGVGAVTTLGTRAPRWLAGRGWRPEWLLPAAVLNVLVLTPELALRVTPAARDMGIRNAYLGSFQRLTPDADLLWRLPAGTPGVNAFGFRGTDITMPKPPGVCRVLYLGDSVEAQGYPPRVAARLHALDPTRCVDTANLSLGGYSSYHGRVLTDKFGVSLDPDVVVVSYGWNDHWRAYGARDATLGRTRDTWWSRALEPVVRHSALLYTLRSARSVARIRPGHLRVPLDEYVDNLRHIGRTFASRGIPVVFLTAPTTHDLYVPAYLVEQGYADDTAAVRMLHRQYGDALRDGVARHGWMLLDLETALADRPDRHALFLYDGIHFTERGLDVVADHVSALLVEILAATCEGGCRLP